MKARKVQGASNTEGCGGTDLKNGIRCQGGEAVSTQRAQLEKVWTGQLLQQPIAAINANSELFQHEHILSYTTITGVLLQNKLYSMTSVFVAVNGT